MGRRRRPLKGAPKAPETWGSWGAKLFFSSTAGEGAAPPEGERNPAEGGYFASISLIKQQSISIRVEEIISVNPHTNHHPGTYVAIV